MLPVFPVQKILVTAFVSFNRNYAGDRFVYEESFHNVYRDVAPAAGLYSREDVFRRPNIPDGSVFLSEIGTRIYDDFIDGLAYWQQQETKYAFFVPDVFGKQAHIEGIVPTMEEARHHTYGKLGAVWKKAVDFRDAAFWLRNVRNETAQIVAATLPINAIYFDAGTGGKIGMEVRVTNLYGESLLTKADIDKYDLNEYGNVNLGFGHKSIQTGELLGFILAIKVAKRFKESIIIGDNKTVIDSWSKYSSKKSHDELTDTFLTIAVDMREIFEEQLGGIVLRVSGNDNPADLGFHQQK